MQEYCCFFLLGPCPFHMGKKPCRTVTDLGISSQRNDSMVLISSTDLSHCLTFFTKFQLVAYQGYFSLIVMYKTVFSSHHADVVSMTETAEKLIQLALVGCVFIASRFRSQLIILQHPHQLFSDTYDLWHLILHMPIEQR